MLKVIYTFFLGIILALFIGVGVSVFYDAPQLPEYPKYIEYDPNGQIKEQHREANEEYEREYNAFQQKQSEYSRNVSVAVTVFAVIFLAIGVGLSHKLDVLADGLLLGGVFTLLYAIGRGLASDDEIYRFIVVSVGLFTALGLGWWKFVKTSLSDKKTQT